MKHQLDHARRWESLRSATSARIALGRAGGSLPTHEWLDFKSAHAAARDAVHHLTPTVGTRDCRARRRDRSSSTCAAADRHTFLKRPDLGRRLDAASEQWLRGLRRTDADARSGDHRQRRPFRRSRSIDKRRRCWPRCCQA